jgi:SAM-dependent methyltransferase
MIVERLKLTQQSLVAEIASNDGYLLQYFQEKEIPCFGIEPSMNVAKAAMDKGLKVVTKFFGAALARKLAAESGQVDLLIGNNVLAHVPDIRDFVSGIHDILQEDGVATLEFPHLMRLVAANQFDTIYHEHYSYLSLSTVCSVFKEFGLTVFDVEELSTHGGSIRIYAGHADAANRQESSSVKELLVCEEAAGMKTLRYYSDFQEKANAVKYGLLSFLIEQKLAGKLVAAYGAAAKGNTLLNYAGVKKDLVSFVVDASPHKQGKFMPGSRIPVTNESEINDKRPDFILILPWNIKEEIMSQLSYIREWGGKFVIPIPALRIEADV